MLQAPWQSCANCRWQSRFTHVHFVAFCFPPKTFIKCSIRHASGLSVKPRAAQQCMSTAYARIRSHTGWLSIKYPTRQYAISPQPVVWFQNFLQLLNPDTSLNLTLYNVSQARIQDFLTGGLTAGGSLPFPSPSPFFHPLPFYPLSPSLPFPLPPSLPLEVGPLKSS